MHSESFWRACWAKESANTPLARHPCSHASGCSSSRNFVGRLGHRAASGNRPDESAWRGLGHGWFPAGRGATPARVRRRRCRLCTRNRSGAPAGRKNLQILLWLVTLAAMLAAALAVGTSSAASVIERQVEIGLMKALGAGSGTVGFLLAAEQLLLAFVGGGVGYALGIVLARLLGERIFGAAPEPSLLVFFVVIGLAAIVTLLGSAIPLRRASRIEPAPILRGE